MQKNFLAGLATGLFMIGMVGGVNADILVSQGLETSAYSASHSWSSYTPNFAFDGDYNTLWNSGSYPTEWVEVDLGQSTSITEILLTVSQSPSPAETTHEIWTSSSSIGGDTSGATLSYTFTGSTSDEDLLSAVFATSLSAQHVQIRTTRSPSWVGWDEIQIMAANPVPEPAVPEPATMLLFGIGLAGLAGSRVRRKKKA